MSFPKTGKVCSSPFSKVSRVRNDQERTQLVSIRVAEARIVGFMLHIADILECRFLCGFNGGELPCRRNRGFTL